MPQLDSDRFEEYYSQRTTKQRQLKIDLAVKVKKIYQSMYSRIYMLLDKSRKDSRYGSTVFNKSVMRITKNIIKDFSDDYNKLLVESGKDFSRYSVMSEIKDLYDMGIDSKSEPDMYFDYIDIYITENMNYVYAQCDRIYNQTYSFLMKDSISVRRTMLLDGLDRKEASVKNRSVKDFIFELFFVDKVMRKRSAESYFELLINSFVQMIEIDSYIYAMTNDGFDLAYVLECDGDNSCSKHEGRVFSVSGHSGNYVYIEDLKKDSNIWHPNCSHLIKVFRENNGVN